jgi:hypothetical protein
MNKADVARGVWPPRFDSKQVYTNARYVIVRHFSTSPDIDDMYGA